MIFSLDICQKLFEMEVKQQIAYKTNQITPIAWKLFSNYKAYLAIANTIVILRIFLFLPITSFVNDNLFLKEILISEGIIVLLLIPKILENYKLN